ncbi:integrin alpha [Nostoc sp.]|uniref:integrin alpha n=1 Tax=Nostoc sp. TaxID=1180 RepID=UPI003036F261
MAWASCPSQFFCRDAEYAQVSSNGFVLNGINERDHSGYSVSSAADINGDGIDDLIIQATFFNREYSIGAYKSYVVFGANNPSC